MDGIRPLDDFLVPATSGLDIDLQCSGPPRPGKTGLQNDATCRTESTRLPPTSTIVFPQPRNGQGELSDLISW